MVPYRPSVLRIWIVVVFVLSRVGIIGCPAVKGCAVVLAVNVD